MANRIIHPKRSLFCKGKHIDSSLVGSLLRVSSLEVCLEVCTRPRDLDGAPQHMPLKM